MEVLTPLVDVIPEARLNLVIYYLKQDDVSEAYMLIKDLEPTVPQEYILKVYYIILDTSRKNLHCSVYGLPPYFIPHGCVQLYSLAKTQHLMGSCTKALVSQDRRHLFVTPWPLPVPNGMSRADSPKIIKDNWRKGHLCASHVEE